MNDARPTLSSTNPGLKATYTDTEVVFSGGKYGDHALSLSVSTPERIRAHWDGYCSVNGAKVAVAGKRVGSGVSFYSRMTNRFGTVVALDLVKGEALICARITQYRGTYRYYEYYVLDSKGYVRRSYKPAELPKKWQAKVTTVASSAVEVLERWDRRQGWTAAKSEPTSRKTPTRWTEVKAS